MEKIRILQVIENLSLNNGVNSVVMNYYNHIDRKQYAFDFLVHESVPQETMDLFMSLGSRIYVMPELRPLNIVRYIRDLSRFFRKHPDYKIIHGHLPNAAIFYLGMAKLFKVPVRIIHSHNDKSADSTIKKLRNNILNSLIPYVANNYAACSKNSAKFLFGKRGKNAFILANAIDMDKFSYSKEIRFRVRKELNLSDQQLVLGHVGRFCAQKNHNYIIDVFKEICSVMPDSKLLLVGDGELLPFIEKKVKLLGLTSNVIFTGISDRVHEYLQAMDAFILPSLFEGFPVSAVEAQLSGLPCFLSDTITPHASFSNRTVFLSIEEPPSVWADKIISCYGSETRESIYNPDFDIKVQVKRLETLYSELYAKAK